jgi:carboxypeptidase family protein
MQSPRSPLFVFMAAFITFMLAFAVMLVLLKPVIDRKREEASRAGAAAPVVASVVSTPAKKPAPAPEPAKPQPAAGAGPQKPAAAPADAGDAAKKSPAERPAAMAGAHDVEFSGHVVDAHGDVPKEAMVHLLVPLNERKADRFRFVASAPVDRSGRFTLTAKVGNAAAYLQAVASGCVRSERKGVTVVGVATADAGDLVVKPGATVRVRVVGEDFNAISSAQVRLVDESNDPEPLMRPKQEARTEADGAAVLRGVDSGDYSVQVSAPGRADAWAKLAVDGGASGDAVISVTLPANVAFVSGTVIDVQHNVVGAGEVTAKLVLPKPTAPQVWRGTIGPGGSFKVGPLPRGRFELDVDATGLVQTGHVLADADGEPAELVCELGGIVLGKMQAAVTQLAHTPKLTLFKRDEKGRLQPFDGVYRADADPASLRFRIDGLGPGSYVVRVLAEGFAPARSAPFELIVGKTVDNVIVPLGDGGEASGRLLDASNAPLAHARVTAFEGLAPPPQALQDLFPSDARQSVFSGDDGRFTLSSLSLGTQTLVIEMPGQPPRTLGPIVVDEKQPSRFGDLLLGGGAILSFTLNQRAGTPAPFATARLHRKDGAVDVRFVADEQGNCCVRGLAAGAFTLSEGTDGDHSDFALRSGDTRRVELAVKSR